MKLSKERGFLSFLLALVICFSFSVFLTSQAFSGQKGDYKGYSKDWKQKNYGTNHSNSSKAYKTNQNKSEKNFSGKNSGELIRNPEKASEVKHNDGKSPENPEISGSPAAE